MPYPYGHKVNYGFFLPSLPVSGFLDAQVPVLFALRETQLFELARCMRNHTVVAGQVVFRQGDAGARNAPSRTTWTPVGSGGAA